MCIGLSLGLGMRLGLGGQVLRLGLGLCMSVGMHMRLGLQVLSLCLSFQALSMSGEALSLGRDLEVARLGGPLEALGMQVLGMGLHTPKQPVKVGLNIWWVCRTLSTAFRNSKNLVTSGLPRQPSRSGESVLVTIGRERAFCHSCLQRLIAVDGNMPDALIIPTALLP